MCWSICSYSRQSMNGGWVEWMKGRVCEWMNDRSRRGGEEQFFDVHNSNLPPSLLLLSLSPSPPSLLSNPIGCLQFSGSPHHAAVRKSVGATLPPIPPSPLPTFYRCKEWCCLWMSLRAAGCEWTNKRENEQISAEQGREKKERCWMKITKVGWSRGGAVVVVMRRERETLLERKYL